MFETACDQARRLLRDVARLGLTEAALDAERHAREADLWAYQRVAEKTAAVVERILARLGQHLPSPLRPRHAHTERIRPVVEDRTPTTALIAAGPAKGVRSKLTDR
jgi:hypothetical protein